MDEIKYIVKLTPVSKKNSQQIYQNKKTGKPFIVPSRQYKEYEQKAAWFLTPKPPRPIDYPVNVKCLFYMPTRRRVDGLNLMEAVDDILVKAGVLEDDNCNIVVAHDGSRVLYDKYNPRTEIIISKMAENQIKLEEY